MKVPVTPPRLEHLFDHSAGRMQEILNASEATPKGRYYHWDKLRHLVPPSDLSPEQWWLGIKLTRSRQYRTLSIQDKIGRKFKYMLPDTVLELLHYVDTHTNPAPATAKNIITEETRDRFVFNSLVEEAITSSQLEGATTTRKEARDMIRYGRQPRSKSQQMILNNYLAMQEIQTLCIQPLSKKMILDLHRSLTHSTLDDPADAGRIQVSDEKRVEVADRATGKILHTPPHADHLEGRLHHLIQFANAETVQTFMHPLIRSIILHFWLAYDHPFVDGNGRTARALFYWSMLHQGYQLFKFLPISSLLVKAPADYNRSFLYTETDESDMTYFIVHQLQVIRKSIELLHKYLERKSQQIQRIRKLLKDRQDLNYREIALLGHAIRHPATEYTIQSHQTSHNVAYGTARSDLHHLAEIGFLNMQKYGRAQVFQARMELERMLSSEK